uniref:Phlebovirus glycoprotein G2 fusion domain-containing protein n=1 Tax=Acrobeloides nanus TaxID=290746 RepID=A0A914ENJ7_9BILA
MLPQIQKNNDTSLFATQQGGEVLAKPSEPVTQLKLTIAGLHLTTTADINTVKIHEVSLRGCYSCEADAQLTLNCQTDFGTAVAHVSCPFDIRFAITCNTTWVKHSV